MESFYTSNLVVHTLAT